MLKLGLTGNIGSGKSTVSRIFETLGVPVFYADTQAKKLYSNNEVKKLVVSRFGGEILTKLNEIDLKILAQIVFKDKSKLGALTDILHPMVFRKYDIWLKNHYSEPFTIHESAIIFEYTQQRHFDKIICVTAPYELRLKRVLNRDCIDEDTVKSRMGNQLGEHIKVSKSDLIIPNDEDSFLIPRVIDIYRKYSGKQ
ncbi:MAG: dephospho-CoA kinase [Chlorobi bacterium]|nr:dephospho-CoA kinase [Chlorobiota bacterium]